MLVLERKIDEGFFITDDVYVKVLSHRDGRIKIGIVAPRDIEIYREEIYHRIQRERSDNNDNSR